MPVLPRETARKPSQSFEIAAISCVGADRCAQSFPSRLGAGVGVGDGKNLTRAKSQRHAGKPRDKKGLAFLL